MTEHEAREFWLADSPDRRGRWGWTCTCGDEVGGYMLLANAESGHKMHADACEADALRKQVRG